MSKAIPVSCYSIKLHIKVWSFKSISEAAAMLKESGKVGSVSQARESISYCSTANKKGWNSQYGGFYWKFSEDPCAQCKETKGGKH